MSVPTFSIYQLGRWLLLANLLIVVACTPETVIQDVPQQVSIITQPTTTAATPAENASTPITPPATPVVIQSSISTEVPVAATAIETSAPKETAVEPAPEPTSLPATIPILLAGQMPMRTLETETTTFSFEEGEGTQYAFSEPGRVVGVLPNDDLLYLTSEGLSTLNLEQRTLQLLIENPLLPILTPRNSDRMLVPTDAPDKQFPVWSIKHDGSEPILLGTTSGYFPFYSATDDGKALLLENGHLVLTWFDGENVQKQQLYLLEERLGLNWDSLNLTLAPDFLNIPWIDFEISPDGVWVAIFDSNKFKLWVAKINGEHLQEIPLDPLILENANDEGPQVSLLSWSPDSKNLAYRESVWSNNPYKQISQLKIFSVSSGQSTPITFARESFARDLSWSLDSQHIIYTYQLLADTSQGVFNESVFLSKSDGTEKQLLAENFKSDGLVGLFLLRNSSRIIYKCRPINSQIGSDICLLETNS